MKSVRRHLLLHLMIALITGSIIVGIVSYLSARDEINELFDENFRQIGMVLEGQKAVLSDSALAVQDRVHLKGEQEFLIQIWTPDMKLVYSTHPLIHFPEPGVSGFETREIKGAAWRSYATKPGDFIVQVSQPLWAREEMTLEIALKILLPLLLQLPILGLLIWLAVGRSLGSLSFISESLKKRSETSLQSLPLQDIPEEIAPLVSALNDLLMRLDDAMKLQRHFIADAAHELRTPVTAVQLQLQLLGRTKNEAERKEAIENLTDGVQRSIRLIEQLLAFAKLEAGTNVQSPQMMDAAAACRESVQFFASRAHEKGIDLGLIRQDQAILSATPDDLHIVINNLIENAIRYTQEGGRVDVASYAENGHTIVEVSDNGPGIALSEQERIFDRFYRIPGNASQGTGLGLALVKSILEKNSATISIGPGIEAIGCSFKVSFPAASI